MRQATRIFSMPWKGLVTTLPSSPVSWRRFIPGKIGTRKPTLGRRISWRLYLKQALNTFHKSANGTTPARMGVNYGSIVMNMSISTTEVSSLLPPLQDYCWLWPGSASVGLWIRRPCCWRGKAPGTIQCHQGFPSGLEWSLIPHYIWSWQYRMSWRQASHLQCYDTGV